MDLSLNMASLAINDRKRRLSGIFKPAKVLVSPPSNSESPQSDNSSPNSESPPTRRRSLRKRVKAPETCTNRRVLLQPKKITQDNISEVKNYYLDKRVKRLPPSLETIYEEPPKTGNGGLMSSRKFRRIINFGEANGKSGNNAKIKRRKMKIKAISAPKRQANKKISIDFLMQKLAVLDE